MLSIKVVDDGQYYTTLAEQDASRYYLTDADAHGVWFGRCAERLGLQGPVDRSAFQRLLEGHHPETGAPLVRNAGKPDRRKGIDLTFSLSGKTCDALWAVADAPVRAAVEQAHDESVRFALDYLQENLGRTRTGHGGHAMQPAGTAIAVFRHGSSRAGDPQLHSHCVLTNVGMREEGTTGTLYTLPIFPAKMMLGALYRAELAAQLTRRLGVVTRRERSWFEIEGVPKALCEAFSTRRREILAGLGTRRASARANEMATLTTRPAKKDMALEDLRATWRAVGEAHGFGQRQVRRCLNRVWRATNRPVDADKVVTKALARLTDAQSHFSERDLIRVAAEAAQGTSLGARPVLDAVRDRLERDPGIVKLGGRPGAERYTTRKMLDLERAMLHAMRVSGTVTRHVVSERRVRRVLKAHRSLSAEQVAAVRYLTRDPGAVQAMIGLAGTGKTSTLRACRQAWERAGLTVYGAALSGKAARGLQDGAGIKSETIASLLRSLEPGRIRFRTFHGKRFRSFHAMLKYAEKVRKPWIRLNRKSVVVIDEASMVDTITMAKLVRKVRQARAKLVLVGDPAQLQPIGPGGPLYSFVRRCGAARLEQVQRQDEAWARGAVQSLSQGRAGEALAEYSRRGLVVVADDQDRAMEALLSHWRERPSAQLEDTLILTSTRDEASELYRRAQQIRARRGDLGAARIRVDGQAFHAGDRVLFTRNSRTYDVKNGTLGTVLSVSGRLDLRPPILRPGMKVLLDDGRRITIDTGHYPHVILGYAMTTHKAQGVTVRDAYVLAGGPMLDMHLAYVQASRAHAETRFYVDRAEAGEDLRNLARAMSRPRHKDLAVDILIPIPTPAPAAAPPRPIESPDQERSR